MPGEKPIMSYSAEEALAYAEEHPLQPSRIEDDDSPAAEPQARGANDKRDSRRQADSSHPPAPSSKGGDEREEPRALHKDEAADYEGDEPNGESVRAGQQEDEKHEGNETEDESEPETDEADEEPDKDEIPQLDPLIEELAKGNPRAEKRVREIAKGLQMLKVETKELKADLEKARPQVEFLDSWNRALADRATAPKALEALIDSVAKHHAIPIQQLVQGFQPEAPRHGAEALLPETDEYGRKREAWERQGYASQKEMELDSELKALRNEIGQFRNDREAMQKEREESRRQAEFKQFIDSAAPKAIKQLEKTENGWKVTKAMVEKAIAEFPQLRNDAGRAVKAMYADELKRHYANSARSRPKGPEMPSDGRAVSKPPADPQRFSAADALASIQG